MTERKVAEFVIVCSNEEVDALLVQLKRLTEPDGFVMIESLSVESTLGAFRGEKVVSFMLSFAVGVANGVVGNVVYDALKPAPTAQCVLEREALPPSVASDKSELDAKIHAVAKPRPELPVEK